MTRKLLLAFGFVCLGASAAPLCVSGTLADYLALPGPCTAGLADFSNFTASVSPLATQIAATSIQVDPVVMGQEAGFRFTFTTVANAGQILGALIGFNVASASSGSIELLGSSVTPDGVNTGVLNLCAGGAYIASVCTGGIESFAIAADDGISPALLSLVALNSFGPVDVLADIVIDGGIGGTSSLTGATVKFNATPEPATWTVLSGLVILAARQWRSRNRNSSTSQELK